MARSTQPQDESIQANNESDGFEHGVLRHAIAANHQAVLHHKRGDAATSRTLLHDGLVHVRRMSEILSMLPNWSIPSVVVMVHPVQLTKAEGSAHQEQSTSNFAFEITLRDQSSTVEMCSVEQAMKECVTTMVYNLALFYHRFGGVCGRRPHSCDVRSSRNFGKAAQLYRIASEHVPSPVRLAALRNLVDIHNWMADPDGTAHYLKLLKEALASHQNLELERPRRKTWMKFLMSVLARTHPVGHLGSGAPAA
jgi:hypothetical protein